MPQDSSSRYDILKATLRLLYRSHPRAFIIGAISSLAEPLFFPAIILLLQQLIQRLSVPQGNTQFSTAAVPVGIAILVLMLIQRIGFIVRDDVWQSFGFYAAFLLCISAPSSYTVQAPIPTRLLITHD
jgi:hypothetical protein